MTGGKGEYVCWQWNQHTSPKTTTDRRPLTSQHRTVNPFNGNCSLVFVNSTFGADPMPVACLTPSITGTFSAESAGERPASTLRAVMKARKVEPCPTTDSTSTPPADGNQNEVRSGELMSHEPRRLTLQLAKVFDNPKTQSCAAHGRVEEGLAREELARLFLGHAWSRVDLDS